MFRSTEIGVQNSIDPCYVEEGRRKYLVWGSFSGLYMGQLSKDGKQLKRPNELTQLAGKAFEGAMIFKRGGYYYLFASVGTCCEGERSTYRTVVGRSRRLAGPYVDRQGGRMLDNHYETVIKGNDPSKGRVLLLDRLLWDQDGWPSVAGGTPSTTPQDAPAL